MVSAFSPNIQLEEPARGDQVGTWDTPVNNNMTLLDKVVGAITTISLNNSNVVLSSPQFQSKTIVFLSTLTGSVTITFPTSFTKSYEIQNLCTGTSAFTITLATTAAGSQAIGAKPGEIFDVVNGGAGNITYKNMGHTGTYWDYAGSSVPNWVSVCTIPPYLNCDGTTFSAATYPALAMVLGSTTLPDARGRVRAALNQGTGRYTTGAGGLDGNTIRSGGGADSVTLATSQMPVHNHQITDPGHVHGISNAAPGLLAGSVSVNSASPGSGVLSASAVTGITINSTGGSGPHANVPPTLIAGITLIRSA